MGNMEPPHAEQTLQFADEPLAEQLELEWITQALKGNALHLNFQPTVSLSESFTESQRQHFEVRCSLSQDAETLPPQRLFAIANRNQLGQQLDCWITFRALKILQLNHQSGLSLTVSLGRESLLHNTYCDWLEELLRDTLRTPDRLTLQISASDIQNGGNAVRGFFSTLKQMGIKICIAESNTTTVDECSQQQLPLDFIKLSATRLMNLKTESRQRMALRKLTSTLHRQQIRVIASQLEDMLLLPVLWRAGVDFVQGNCLQPPDYTLSSDYPHHQSITLH